MKRSRGLTLVELLVTVAVAAVLALVAVPGFQSMVYANRRAALANDLVAAINLARSEAVKRATYVSLCVANTTGDACRGSATGWEQGWMVFLDPATTGSRQDGEEILALREPLDLGVTLRGDGSFANTLTFESTGTTLRNDALTYTSGGFTLCVTPEARHAAQARRRVAVDPTGRVHIQSAIPDTCP